MESSGLERQSIGSIQGFLSGHDVGGSDGMKCQGLKGSSVTHGVSAGDDVPAACGNAILSQGRRKELPMARRSLPGFSTEDKCWSHHGGRGEGLGGNGGEKGGGGEIPPTVLWTTVCTSYIGRTVVLNFRDSGLTDGLRGFVQVRGRVWGRVWDRVWGSVWGRVCRLRSDWHWQL